MKFPRLFENDKAIVVSVKTPGGPSEGLRRAIEKMRVIGGEKGPLCLPMGAEWMTGNGAHALSFIGAAANGERS